MSFETITAPHINANDLEMLVSEWFVKPWQFIESGEEICEVETTKATLTVESEQSGYIYPLIKEQHFVKVGEPIAHLFPENDPKQLDLINQSTSADSSQIITKKAYVLMEKFDLSISDFPKFSSISSDTVIAKIKELKLEAVPYDKHRTTEILDKLKIEENSLVIYGEPNQALMALDAYLSNQLYQPIAYIDASLKSETFYVLPTLHNKALKKLKDKGLKHIYLCGQNAEINNALEMECEAIGLIILTSIHNSSIISRSARLGKGVFIGAQAYIGPDVEIGDFSRVLCGATVAHHCKLGKYVNISDGAHLGGNVIIKDYSLIGIGGNVNKRVEIGKNSTVVSGATVTDNVSDNQIVRIDNQVVLKKK